MVVSQVLGEPVPGAALAGGATVLEALQAGIAGQLAGAAWHRQSSFEVLEVAGAVVVAKLTGHMVREIKDES